jgi:hypothetical protein
VTRFICVLFLLLAVSRCGSVARAQVSDEVVVARVCVSESGFDTTECAAITHALVANAAEHGMSVRAMAFAYSPRATGRTSYGPRSWIASLHPDRRVAVPGRSDEWVRVRFAALVSTAWLALRNMTATPCPGSIHWSARWCRDCVARMGRTGFVRCAVATANVFWMRGRT